MLGASKIISGSILSHTCRFARRAERLLRNLSGRETPKRVNERTAPDQRLDSTVPPVYLSGTLAPGGRSAVRRTAR